MEGSFSEARHTAASFAFSSAFSFLHTKLRNWGGVALSVLGPF